MNWITNLLFLLLTLQRLEASDHPNILWLVSEDSTTLLGCYGDPLAKTPTLDKLASDGVLFENCFAQPVCATSRFSLITGTFAASFGPAQHMRAEGKIPPPFLGFPALLRKMGYYTSNNDKTDYNAAIEINEVWNESSNQAHWRKRSELSQPFFSVFNYMISHESCLFPKVDLPLDFCATDPIKVRIPPYQPDTPEIRSDWARYYDHLALLDQQISVKLEELKNDGLADDTIIFYYGDNGGTLPRSKRFLQASGTHVPLIMYFPPKWQHLAPALPGSRVKNPVSFIDFAPTVLSLTGVKIPGFFQGRPFAGSEARANEFVFCTRDRMDERYDMMRSVMDSRWLYIRNYRPDLPYVQSLNYMFKARGYQSWARMAREGKLTPATAQFWGEKPSEELYDRIADPDNVNNLSSEPAHREILARMRAALKKHTLEIFDNGFLPESSSLEGYTNSHKANKYPLERVFEIANLASDRNSDNLPQLITAINDPSEPVRWWAVQGCTILGKKAKPAEVALRRSLADESGAVQIAAAEALARLGKLDEAFPVLLHWIQCENDIVLALQSSNVLDRLGELARPILPTLKLSLEAVGKSQGKRDMGENYFVTLLMHTISVLEGRTQALNYPKIIKSSSSNKDLNARIIDIKPDNFSD